MSAESVCKRVASTEETAAVRETALPEDGVKLNWEMGSVKLSTSRPVGGVSNIVMLTVALLPPQPVTHPPPLGPLQDASENKARTERTTKDILKFMQTPAANRAPGREGVEFKEIFPRHTVPRSPASGAGKTICVFNY